MAEIRVVVGFLPVVLIILASLAAINAGGAAGFSFEQWCGRTTRNDVCLNTIRNDPRANLKSDPAGIFTILGDKAKAVATSTYQKITDALSHATDPQQKQDLQTCLDVYDEAIAILRPLDFSVLNHQTYQLLNLSLQKALQEPSECEDAFKSHQKAPPFTVEDKNLEDVVTATLDVLNLNECDKTACN